MAVGLKIVKNLRDGKDNSRAIIGDLFSAGFRNFAP